MGYHKKQNIIKQSLHNEAAYQYYCQAICYIESYLLTNITPEDVKRLCMKYENAVPVMVGKSREYICEFAKIYPIGAALII